MRPDMRERDQGYLDDPNVMELHRLSNPAEYGNMLRLASTIEFLRDSDLDGSSDLWSYLRSKDFKPEIVESVAKPYWQKACHVVEQIPYRHVVTSRGCRSQYRLMAYFLREVCIKMNQG